MLPAVRAAGYDALEGEVVGLPDLRLRSVPFPLEPQFRGNDEHALTSRGIKNPVRLHMYLSKEETLEWEASELFVRQLGNCRHQVRYEILGNHGHIETMLVCDAEDASLVRTAFKSTLTRAELARESSTLIDQVRQSKQFVFRDYYTSAPITANLTTYELMAESPYASPLYFLSCLGNDSVAFCQVVFVPAAAAWHRCIRRMSDVAYLSAVYGAAPVGSSFGQQIPTATLARAAANADAKAHPDRRSYAVAIRVSISGPAASPTNLNAVDAFLGLLQWNGSPFSWLDETAYRNAGIDPISVIVNGAVHRPGFIINSKELTGLVHIPPGRALTALNSPVRLLESTIVPTTNLSTGTHIGDSHYAGLATPIRISDQLRTCHTYVVGAQGTGKTNLLVRKILQDIHRGVGVAYIDPHGDAAKLIAAGLSPEARKRTVVVRPGDPEHVLLFNPLAIRSPNQRHAHISELVAAFKRGSTGWGPRLETALLFALLGISYIQGSHFADAYEVVSKTSVIGKRLRSEIVRTCPDKLVRDFFRDEFDQYPKDAFAAVHHQQQKLLVGGSEALMFSQPANTIDLRRAMDDGQILLIDLSDLGGEKTRLIGSLFFSLFLSAALSRADIESGQRRPFYLYADEGHKFTSGDALESIIVQGRKFGLGLTFAHHTLSQLSKEQIDAVSLSSSKIIARVDKNDAAYFAKDLEGKITPEELVSLKRFEAVAKIDTEIVRLKMPAPVPYDNGKVWRELLEHSHSRYYRPRGEVERDSRKPTPLPAEEIPYDEL